jgi:hypothetical protein
MHAAQSVPARLPVGITLLICGCATYYYASSSGLHIESSSQRNFMTTISYLDSARRTINMESEAVRQLLTRLDANFERACDILLNCRGRVVVSGMGKSGHIGTKIASTLASTGTPSMFVHPAEASHGDLGMITAGC